MPDLKSVRSGGQPPEVKTTTACAVLGEKKFRATYKKEETVDIKEKSLKESSIFFLPKEKGKDKRILLLKKIRGTSRSAICGLEALIPISPWQSFYGLQTSLYFWRLGGIMERSV